MQRQPMGFRRDLTAVLVALVCAIGCGGGGKSKTQPGPGTPEDAAAAGGSRAMDGPRAAAGVGGGASPVDMAREAAAGAGGSVPTDAAAPDASRDTAAEANLGDTRDAASADLRDALAAAIAVRPANPTCKPPANIDQPAMKLSDTGCFDKADPKKPGAMLIPFDVASPLWSDAADKERFIALPDGMKIHIKNCAREPKTCGPRAEGGTTDDEGHFILPIGTVLVKTFKLGARYIETRLLIRFDEFQWMGYSYEWNDAQTDATVFPDAVGGVTKMVRTGSGGMQSWSFPSRSECFQCHTRAVGTSIGPMTTQLNRDMTYPSGVRANQMDVLEAIGLFDMPAARLPPLPTPQSTTATVTERARSYMQANCAICHRPEGNFAAIDLRYGTPIKEMNICNVDPERTYTGMPTGAKRMVPGMAARSTMWTRMNTLDAARMPQIGTRMVDTLGTMLVGSWINSVAACP